MDGHASSLTHPPRDRANPPYPRTASRSSNSTGSTRVASHGSGNANYAAASPRLAGHSLHRPYSTSGAKFHHHSGGQHSPYFPPRESAIEATRQSPMSSYLLEKLQRERKDMDGKSVASLRIAGDPSSRPDSPGVQSSPIRRDHLFDVRRPISSGNVDSGAKKGLGIKEMEQTLSTLHKQNFDLKLELYHRREKQTALEERVDNLVSEKTQMEEMNDKLLEELEKRDKAVEEAAAMIVMLESQVETLLREREMVRLIEARTAYGPATEEEELDGGGGMSGRMTTPRPRGAGAGLRVPAAAPEGFDEEVLHRMPSFVSERSEATENLRNVYVGIRGSPLSVAGNGLLDPENDRNNHLASPSLSVLSTSSFLSVYGKNKERNFSEPPPGMEGNHVESSRTPDRPRGVFRDGQYSDRVAPSSRQSRSNSVSHGTSSSQFQSLGNILGHDSPLQRLEKMHGERAHSLRTSSSRQSATQERELQPQQNQQQPELPPQRPATVAPLKTSSQRRTKEEKREALRRVMTDGPAGSRLRDHTLPPTPDTISSMTLRRFKNSSDTLSQQPSLSNERSYLALSETTTAASPEAAQPQPHSQPQPQPLTHKALAKIADEAITAQPPSITAFNSRRDAGPGAGGGGYFDTRHPVIQRPRSAGETTASRHRGNGWDSESDDDDDEDDESAASSLDIWMREGWRPKKPYATVGGRASPDLFNFPASKSGGAASSSWAPDAMFGAFATPKSPARGEGPGLLGSGGGPPPPPNRRSSLHAQTGSASAIAILDAISKNEGSAGGSGSGSGRTSRREGSSSRRGRAGHVRRNSDNDVAASLATLAASQAQLGGGGDAKLGKGKDYPPSAGQQQQGRSRVLNRFFRRSLGSAGPAPSSPASVAADAAHAAEGAPGNSGAGGGGGGAGAAEPNFSASVGTGSRNGIGFPSWIHRGGVAEDERWSATPPPIMRSRAASGRERERDREEGDEDGGVDLGGYAGGGVGVGDGAVGGDGGVALGGAQGKGFSSGGGGGGNDGASVKRKWLPGFGRNNSLRNRN